MTAAEAKRRKWMREHGGDAFLSSLWWLKDSWSCVWLCRGRGASVHDHRTRIQAIHAAMSQDRAMRAEAKRRISK
jgi:hypothetical protein